jgi:uncharacterized protein (TIGR03435 family)
VKTLIQAAYRVQDFQIIGGPAWIDAEGFDIVATPDREIVFDNPATDAMPRMLQLLLEDRFQLKVHRETREMSVYAMVIGRTGPKLQEAKQADGKNWGFNYGPGGLTATNAPMSVFSDWLSGQVGRSVINKTDLNGYFDFTLRFVPDPLATKEPVPEGPSIFTALQEELGLRLESDKGSVEVIVIDSVQRPSEN